MNKRFAVVIQQVDDGDYAVAFAIPDGMSDETATEHELAALQVLMSRARDSGNLQYIDMDAPILFNERYRVQ